MSYTKWILLLSNVPILAAAIYALSIYKKLGDNLRIFSWFIFLTIAIQVPYLVLWFKSINNLPLLHVYVLLSFICLGMFYKGVLRYFVSPVIINSLIVLFSCFCIVNSLYLQNIWTFNSNALTVMSVLIVILSLSTFVILMNDAVKQMAGNTITSIRWINSGLFIYYSSSLLLFYFGSDIIKEFSTTLNRYAWILNSFFLTVMYIFFIIGLWKQKKASDS